jgi:hypothetical protein
MERSLFQTSRKMIVFFLMVVGLLQSCNRVEKIVDVQDPTSKLIPILLQPTDINLSIVLQHDLVFQRSQIDSGIYKREQATRIFDGVLDKEALVYFEHILECYSRSSSLGKLDPSKTSNIELNLQTYGEKSLSSCTLDDQDNLQFCRVETWYPGNIMSVFIFRINSNHPSFESANEVINIALAQINENIASQDSDMCISFKAS